MNDSAIPVAVREWPLQEKDITEDVCKTCGICCEIEIKTSWPDVRRIEWLGAIVENHDNIVSIYRQRNPHPLLSPKTDKTCN